MGVEGEVAEVSGEGGVGGGVEESVVKVVGEGGGGGGGLEVEVEEGEDDA